MADTKGPQPGMGQDEKDRLGLLAVREAERDTWAPDESLEEMTTDELKAEAAVRRVDLADAKTNPARVKALRVVDPLPDRGRVPVTDDATGEFDATAAEEAAEEREG